MSTQKDLIIQYSKAELIKELIIDIMSFLTQYEDFYQTKKTEPNGMHVLEWTFNKLQQNASFASSICKGEYFESGEKLIEKARIALNRAENSFGEVIERLREALTKITTEGARAAEKLFS